MTRIIELGKRGRLVIYMDYAEEGSHLPDAICISNESSCTLVVDGKLVNPGETV